MKKLITKRKLFSFIFVLTLLIALYPIVNGVGCNAKFYIFGSPLGESVFGRCELGVVYGVINSKLKGEHPITFKAMLAVWGKQHYLIVREIDLGVDKDFNKKNIKDKGDEVIFSLQYASATLKRFYSWKAMSFSSDPMHLGAKNVIVVSSDPFPALSHITLYGRLSYIN
ncbi:TPA: hypothetical protein RQN76_004154 [Aeromonas dhakensis]|nr:hypothetical protein [Aeromonas dhakensis]